ncbi:sulfotransferase domain-containing protein [Dinoroseobacter sp. S76]|uniref:sulfotransferase domain-containing protein n=1 Tax=Dinoroseobacter sp. S76 TaxID=3415124 RepID=UPI003C7AEFB4
MHDTVDFVAVVSGLPRSGTSMMMRMLTAGGFPPVVDHEREPNDDNPLGYFEFEPVKALKEDDSWVAKSTGQVVKVIYKLVYDLPIDVPYRIVFLQRDLGEVVASQEKMLEREGLDPNAVDRDLMIKLFQGEVFDFQKWARAQRNIEILFVDYSTIVTDPASSAARIAEFFDCGLDVQAMAEAVDPSLYRNRA